MEQLSDQDTLDAIMTVINGVPHGVAMINGDETVIGINHYLEALTGYNSEEIKGHPVEQVVRSNIGLYREKLQKFCINEERSVQEGDIINANRKKIPIRITISPLNERTDTTRGYLLFIEDITPPGNLSINRQSIDNSGIIGCSSAMQELMELFPVLAHSDTNLLITGETGTGKDLLAEAIHKASKRSKAPFIKVNCGALPEFLLESELFGHVRGAFTGAHSDKQGMFRLAQGGTIFLTEIGDLPLPLQVKLLTVLDDREFFPVGGTKKIKVDVRLITGTHRDLAQLVRERKFREDLYFRLNILRAHMPPLRDRGDDIKLLLEHFLHVLCKNLDKNISGFDQKTEFFLCNYLYPGNVRELRNIIEYAINICQNQTIKMAHLPGYLHNNAIIAETNQTAPIDGNRDKPPSSPRIDERADQINKKRDAKSWSEFEKQKIFDTLVNTGGNRSEAAKLLGWWRSKLLRKIKLYGLE